jgi:hypothetical protein
MVVVNTRMVMFVSFTVILIIELQSNWRHKPNCQRYVWQIVLCQHSSHHILGPHSFQCHYLSNPLRLLIISWWLSYCRSDIIILNNDLPCWYIIVMTLRQCDWNYCNDDCSAGNSVMTVGLQVSYGSCQDSHGDVRIVLCQHSSHHILGPHSFQCHYLSNHSLAIVITPIHPPSNRHQYNMSLTNITMRVLTTTIWDLQSYSHHAISLISCC